MRRPCGSQRGEPSDAADAVSRRVAPLATSTSHRLVVLLFFAIDHSCTVSTAERPSGESCGLPSRFSSQSAWGVRRCFAAGAFAASAVAWPNAGAASDRRDQKRERGLRVPSAAQHGDSSSSSRRRPFSGRRRAQSTRGRRYRKRRQDGRAQEGEPLPSRAGVPPKGPRYGRGFGLGFGLGLRLGFGLGFGLGGFGLGFGFPPSPAS